MNNLKAFIKQIEIDTGIDVTQNIVDMSGYFVLLNDSHFDFGRIFAIDGYKSGVKTDLIPFGTSEDNNIYIRSKYCQVLKGYYVLYYEKDDKFILRKW